jgi:hypothetical protein
MSTRRVAAVALLLTVEAFIPVAAAQTQAPPPQITVARRPDAPAGRARPVAVRSTSVMGFAWTATNEPIADATVRLRNVLSGLVEATVTTSQTGEFLFENVEGGATYVVELVGANGQVRAIGHQFTVAPGETVATFVRLGVQAPWFTGMFGNTAAAVVSSAASLGVAAVVPPEQAISPNK